VFQCNGVPLAYIVDGSKEQVKGEFMHKLKEASCQLSRWSLILYGRMPQKEIFMSSRMELVRR
jgi:hypothetical protein